MSSPKKCAEYYYLNHKQINARKRLKYHAMSPEKRARRLAQMRVVVKRIEQAHNKRIGR